VTLYTGRICLSLIVAILVAPVGLTPAASGHAGNTDVTAIHACVGNLTKVVRIVGIDGACLSTPPFAAEMPVHWAASAKGPVGPAALIVVDTVGTVAGTLIANNVLITRLPRPLTLSVTVTGGYVEYGDAAGLNGAEQYKLYSEPGCTGTEMPYYPTYPSNALLTSEFAPQPHAVVGTTAYFFTTAASEFIYVASYRYLPTGECHFFGSSWQTGKSAPMPRSFDLVPLHPPLKLE
jgi:hypothetical protein